MDHACGMDRYQAFSQASGRRLARMDDEAFARYGPSLHGVTRLRERFAAWPRT